VSAEIENATGLKAVLVGGGGGIFEIRRDGEVLFAKERGGAFPGAGEAAALFTRK
jgi:predicted Rdx family selenoprotein